MYDRLKLLPRKCATESRRASSNISKWERFQDVVKVEYTAKVKKFSIIVEKGGVYSTHNSASKKTDNFLDYIELGVVNLKNTNGKLHCVLTEEQKRQSLKKLRFLTMQEQLGQLENSSSRSNRKLEIDMCNSKLKKRDNEICRRTSLTSKKSIRMKPKPQKLKSDPSIEFELFCLKTENICLLEDIKHDPNYQDILRDQLK